MMRWLAFGVIAALILSIVLLLDVAPVSNTHIYVHGSTTLRCERTERLGFVQDECQLEGPRVGR
jgi:hypothetical protein